MNDWKEYKLGELVRTNRKSISSAYEFDEIQYLDTGSITEGKIESFQKFKLSDAPSRAKRLVEQDDIIYSTVRPIQRHYGFITNPQENLVVSTGFATITTNKKLLRPKYLYYLLTNNETVEYLDVIAEASTSAYPSLKPSDIENLEILLPPLPIQTAIASVLSSLDDKIDLLHRQNATLEKMAGTLFRQWFVEEAKEEWEEISFGEFLIPKKGKNLTKEKAVDGEFPVVAGGLEPMCTHNISNTQEPVITISASGANAGYVRLYNQKVWSSDSSYIDNTVTPYVYFSYLFLKSNQNILFDKQTGSAQPHIYPKEIMELEFQNYPIELLNRFENWCNNLFLKIKLNQNQIRTLTTLRDTLLPKLMNGEVRV